MLSVWRDQEAFDVAAKPGSIVAVYGTAVNKNYEEDVVNNVLKLVPTKVPHGHLNVYNSNPVGWFEVEPTHAQGYAELVKWRDEVLAKEIQEELEEAERKRKDEQEEKEGVEREKAELNRQREMENARIREEEQQEGVMEETEEEQVARLEAKGMIWRGKNGKPFWKVDGY